MTSIQDIMAEKYLEIAQEPFTTQRKRIRNEYARMSRLVEWARQLLTQEQEQEGGANTKS